MDSTEMIPSYVAKENDYATNNYASTALGFGIAGTALGLLNGGLGLFSGFGGKSSKSSTSTQSDDVLQLERKECADYLQITKDYYEGKLSNLRELTESFYTLDQKIQAADRKAELENRSSFDVLNKRIIDLEKCAAVNAATAPLYQIITDMKISGVSSAAMGAVAIEAERRNCTDNKIVNYVNSTFYPQQIADITTGSTTTQKKTYNPLRECNCGN